MLHREKSFIDEEEDLLLGSNEEMCKCSVKAFDFNDIEIGNLLKISRFKLLLYLKTCMA